MNNHIARKMWQAFFIVPYVHFTVAPVHPLDGAGGPVEAELAADHRGLGKERQNGKVNNTYGIGYVCSRSTAFMALSW